MHASFKFYLAVVGTCMDSDSSLGKYAPPPHLHKTPKKGDFILHVSIISHHYHASNYIVAPANRVAALSPRYTQRQKSASPPQILQTYFGPEVRQKQTL